MTELKGYKRKIIEFIKANPMESECDLVDTVLGLEEILKEYREKYAKACVEASLKEAAKNAKVKTHLDYSMEVAEVSGHSVDKSSILDPSNIIIL